MTVSSVMTHNGRGLFRAGLFMDTIAREVGARFEMRDY